MGSTMSRIGANVTGAALKALTLRPLSIEVRMLMLAVTVGAVLYTVMFSGISPVHDSAHGFRHSILSVICH